MMQTVTAQIDAQLLSNHISDYLGIDEDSAYKLAEELVEYGIETEEQFDDAYQGEFDSYKNEAEFAENLYNELGEISPDSSLYSFIDWQQVWDCQLRYDYFVIDTYFFRNI
jgi:hypothetical protein